MPTPDRAKPRPRKRAATEEALLDAFERVLARDGIRNLTVNAIVGEAGVAKPLLYRYFGDLDGLVAAWGQRRTFWPAPAPVPQAPGRADPEFRTAIRTELVHMANYLREHPVTLEFLAEELSARTDVSAAFGQVRRERGRAMTRNMLSDSRYVQREHRRLIIVLYAAVVYLAMRARRSPLFMGLRLDTEEGWRDALDMVGEIISTAPVPAPGRRRAPSRKGRPS